MRISDWSSDVCSSDLLLQIGLLAGLILGGTLGNHVREGAGVGFDRLASDLALTANDRAEALERALVRRRQHLEVLALQRDERVDVGRRQLERRRILAHIQVEVRIVGRTHDRVSSCCAADDLCACAKTQRAYCGGKRRSQEIIVQRTRSEEHTSELQSLMRISYDVFCLKNKTHK